MHSLDIPQDVARSTQAARSPRAIIIALCLAQFAVADGATGLFVMLPGLYREFAAQSGAVKWIITAFFLTAAVLAPIAGRLADLLGRGKVAITTLCCAVGGGILGGLSDSLGMLIVASVLLGMCTALPPILVGLAREHLEPTKVGFAIGCISAAGSAGAGLAFLVTGIVIDHFGRSGGYALGSALSLTAVIFLIVGLPKSHPMRFRLSDIDFIRGILFGPAVGGMIFSVEQIATGGWRSVSGAPLLLASLLLAIYWWRDQLKHPRPLIHLRLLSHGTAARVLIVMALLGLSMQSGQILSLLFQQQNVAGLGFGMSASWAGLMMVPINSTAAIVGPSVGWLAKRSSARAVALAGAAIMATGWICFFFGLQSLQLLVVSGVISMVGLSLLLPSLYMLIVEATPLEETSGAAGMAYTFFNLGVSVGSQIVLGVIMGKQTTPGSVGGYQVAFVWLTFVTALMIPVLWSRNAAKGRRSAEGG